MLRFARVLFCVVLAGVILQADITPAGAAPVRCDGNVLVIGARGSGEPARLGNLGMGKTVYDAYHKLEALAPRNASFQPLGLDYPAQDVPSSVVSAGDWYLSSYAVGLSRLRAELARHAVACRQQRFVLMGYSQGAHVVGDAVAELTRHEPLTARSWPVSPGW